MKIFVATPTGEHSVSSPYWATTKGLEAWAEREGHALYVKPLFGCSDLIKARNALAHLSLKWGADVLLTFDSDQYADPETLAPTILGAEHYGLCASPVPRKMVHVTEGERWNFFVEDGEPVVEGPYMRVDRVGAGCMAISRRVLLAVCKRTRFFLDDGEPIPELYARDFVEQGLFTRQMSEDFSFCYRARASGFAPWLYVPGHVKHYGTTVFEGKLHV